jgi:sphingolipid delta-4 desaturase
MREDGEMSHRFEGDFMTAAESTNEPPGGFRLKFHPRILGTAAPVFPGFEIDISDRVQDQDKPDAVWHRERAKKMIQAHPEIKELFGNTPSTAVWCLLFAAMQVGLAFAASLFDLWIVVLVAWVVGPWININLFMLAHECNHSLVFKKTWLNRWLFTLTTLPMFLSGHHTWWIEHHVHHNDLGAKKDFIKRRRSILLMTKQRVAIFFTKGPIHRMFNWFSTPLFQPYSLFMITAQAVRSLIGLIVYVVELPFRRTTVPSDRVVAILADEHLVSGYERYGVKRWAVAYPLLSLSLVVALFLVGGWKSVLYLLLSSLFLTGFLHPTLFGMILSNSHFHGHSTYQPSASYYGWYNRLTFNFGLHTEHHDIAGIAWSRLPRLRQIAPEAYDDLVKTRSYFLLALQFVFCSRSGLAKNFGNEIRRNLEMNASAKTDSFADETDSSETACSVPTPVDMVPHENEAVG